MNSQSQRDCVNQPRVAESARLPWVRCPSVLNPEGVQSVLRQPNDATPLGLVDNLISFPRVARSSQPWAERWNPFGILSCVPSLAEQRQLVSELEAERALVEANRELAARFEQKLQSRLAEIWGEAPNKPSVPSTKPSVMTNTPAHSV